MAARLLCQDGSSTAVLGPIPLMDFLLGTNDKRRGLILKWRLDSTAVYSNNNAQKQDIPLIIGVSFVARCNEIGVFYSLEGN